MKKCPFCGADLTEEAAFCVYCMRSLAEKKRLSAPLLKDRKAWRTVVFSLAVILAATAVTAGAIGLRRALDRKEAPEGGEPGTFVLNETTRETEPEGQEAETADVALSATEPAFSGDAGQSLLGSPTENATGSDSPAATTKKSSTVTAKPAATTAKPTTTATKPTTTTAKPTTTTTKPTTTTAAPEPTLPAVSVSTTPAWKQAAKKWNSLSGGSGEYIYMTSAVTGFDGTESVSLHAPVCRLYGSFLDELGNAWNFIIANDGSFMRVEGNFITYSDDHYSFTSVLTRLMSQCGAYLTSKSNFAVSGWNESDGGWTTLLSGSLPKKTKTVNGVCFTIQWSENEDAFWIGAEKL